MATLTAAGLNGEDGTLNGQYTGTSKVASLPIGSIVWCNTTTNGQPILAGVNSTVPYVKYYSLAGSSGCVYYISSAASAANFTNLSGTWRLRGGSVDGCTGALQQGLVQRVA